MNKRVFYGDVAWVRDDMTGYYQGRLPDGRHMRLHRYVFECEVGPIPAEMSVHHIDGDKNNNAPDNLGLMPARKMPCPCPSRAQWRRTSRPKQPQSV